ncbi:MAG TPA: hypothetical protein VI160_04105 [Gemmatimonadales bacterium]
MPHARGIAVLALIGAAACRRDATAPRGGGLNGVVLTATVPMPANYGIHDTFVRDGIAFVCVWNSGVQIYDVGNGIAGGSPASPAPISTIITTGGEAHNAWWFWNPNTGEKKYLFVGQEGPGTIGSTSSGDIHVVDVSDLSRPREVGAFHLTGAGTHNFWMDEQRQILYAAYYHAGVASLDVSGTLAGDLSARGIDTIAPGDSGNTYTWSVHQAGGSLYAIDMLSGLWRLGDSLGHLRVAGGGNNVPARYSSDLWIQGTYAYTGTWDWSRRTGKPGSVLNVWSLDSIAGPTLVDTIDVANVAAVSDVEVSPDDKLLMFSTEGGAAGAAGFYFYSLADPARPAYLAQYDVDTGIHTATFGTIGGRLYAFGAKNPGYPALIILDVSALDR